MKKLIFSIAALAAIVVMGSCSQDSDLTNKTASSKAKQDSVTIGLSINTGITVSESNSSMAKSTANVPVTRAAVATRAEATSSSANTNTTATDFAPIYPSSYTVYFVADGKQGDYTDNEIVYTMNITANNSSLTTATTSGSATEVYSATGIKIPAIKYTVFVTNSSTAQKAGDQFQQETLPTSSTTLYLNNGDGTKVNLTSTSTNRTVAVNLTNNYAAVAVAHNDFVSKVTFTNGTHDMDYGDLALGSWYYLYIKGNNTNSTITLQNIENVTSPIKLTKTITAGSIYQFTINDNYTGGTKDSDGNITDNSGSGDGLTISVTPFTKQADTHVSVY
jgi:hypothetical protein